MRNVLNKRRPTTHAYFAGVLIGSQFAIENPWLTASVWFVAVFLILTTPREAKK